MESSSSKLGKSRKPKNPPPTDTCKVAKRKRQKKEGRALNQDLLDRFPASSMKSRRVKSKEDGLEDNQKFVGDIWTKIRGYYLFIFHWKRRMSPELVSNPWRLNIGRLVVPNVFISLELIKSLTNRYDPKTKIIYNKDNKPLVPIRKDFIETIFNLDFRNEAQIDVVKLKQEYIFLEST